MGMAAKGRNEVVFLQSGWRERLAEHWPVLLLAVLGLIWSLSFRGHFTFPNSDYFSFVRTGRAWLSFQIPDTMKRAPVFSVIAGLLSVLFAHPGTQLAATEMYNALLLPVSMILFYLVGRGLLGRPAAMVTAFLAGISPWMVRMSSEALAEMTLVVLFAVAVLCVARGRMGWAYVFAMLASITRWDMAGLIPAVALADLARNRRVRPMLWKAALASAPFLLCMVITKMQLAGEEKGAHYLQVLAQERQFALREDLHSYWKVMSAWANAPLVRRVPGGVRRLRHVNATVFWSTAIGLGLAFGWGSLYGLMKRRWEILAILVAGVPYVLVHAVYPYRLARFCVPMAWAGMIIAAYGAKSILDIVREKWRAWPYVKPVLQVVAAGLFVAWAIGVGNTLAYGIERRACPGIGTTVCWSVVIAVAGYLGYEWLRAARPGLHWVAVSAFLVLAVVSSGTQVAALIGDGKVLTGFKTLSLWFKEHARPDDRMVTNMPGYLPIYTGLPQDRFVHTAAITPEAAPDLPGFVRECRRMGVTLIAWDSGLAGNTQDRYYQLWGLHRISPLGRPLQGERVTQIGPCRLVHLIPNDWPQIAVWRITPPE
jgi:hypothetical protein